jgi:hypothetical protein
VIFVLKRPDSSDFALRFASRLDSVLLSGRDNMLYRFSICAVLLAILPLAHAGEVILSENFDQLDLAKLPPGWSLVTPDEVSITTTPDKGKALRIVHKGGGQAALVIPLDVAKARGHTVRATAVIKCPEPFMPAMDKGGFPHLSLTFGAAGGGSRGIIARPNQDVRGWQVANISLQVPADAESVAVTARVPYVATEALFDDIKVELEGEPVAPAAPAGQTQTPAAPATPPAAKPPDATAQAPAKALDQDGLSFGPDIAAATKAAKRRGATPATCAFAGPGAPLAGLDAKQSQGWTVVPSGKEIAGAAAPPEALLSALPLFITKNKPEVIFLVAESAGARKLSRDERYNWEDLARLCLRLGAVPVLVVPPAGTLDELRREVVWAAEAVKCPMLDPKPPTTLSLRTSQTLDLVARHVFDRKPARTPDAARGKLDVQEE